MANTVDIYLKGHDQASSAVADVDRNIGRLNETATIAKGTLAGILSAQVITQLGDFGLKAVDAVIALGQMGEESAQLDAKFQAISGSVSAAARNFTAMDDAVGGWLTRDEKMNASIRIMSLGLADSAIEAGDLAKMAITLGDSTQSAEDRINTFTQMLATGQTRGLAQFGISVISVRERVDELKAANAGMTTEMATQQAIIEAATERMGLLGDYMPVTQTQQMKNATDDLKDSIADLVAQPYTVTVSFITTGVENLIGLLNRTSNDSTQQLAGYEQQLKAAREELAKMQDASGKGILGGIFNQQYTPEQLAAVQKNIDDLTAKVEYMRTANAEAGDVGVAALDKQNQSAILLKDNLQKVEDAYLKTQDAAQAEPDTPQISIDKAKTAFTDAATKDIASEVLDAMFGLRKDKSGKKPADEAAKNAMNALASSIGVTVKDKDFAGKMIGYGETIWGLTEEGMIGKAKTSTAFQQAIDAMVAAAIAGALQ